MLQATGYPAEIADFYSAISAGCWAVFLVAKIVRLVMPRYVIYRRVPTIASDILREVWLQFTGTLLASIKTCFQTLYSQKRGFHETGFLRFRFSEPCMIRVENWRQRWKVKKLLFQRCALCTFHVIEGENARDEITSDRSPSNDGSCEWWTVLKVTFHTITSSVSLVTSH